MVNMLVWSCMPGLGEYQDIIQIKMYLLNMSRSIGESKWHRQTFIMTDTNQLVGVAEIKFGEYGHSLEEFEGGGDQRQKVTVLDGDIVEPTIVDTRS